MRFWCFMKTCSSTIFHSMGNARRSVMVYPCTLCSTFHPCKMESRSWNAPQWKPRKDKWSPPWQKPLLPSHLQSSNSSSCFQKNSGISQYCLLPVSSFECWLASQVLPNLEQTLSQDISFCPITHSRGGYSVATFKRWSFSLCLIYVSAFPQTKCEELQYLF